MTELNASQQAQYKSRILARLAELQEDTQRGAVGTAIVHLDQQSVGRLSRMDALQNQAMAKAHEARRASEIKRLETALERLDAGEYGYCEDCGAPIPEGRLKLDLAAHLCVSCVSG